MEECRLEPRCEPHSRGSRKTDFKESFETQAHPFSDSLLSFSGFPGSWAGKESACIAGESSSFPGSRRSPWRRDRLPTPVFLSFSGGSDSRESAWNAGDLGSIPGSGRSPGEGIGYPLQYSWASWVAQTVKNLPNNVGDLDSLPGLGRSSGGGHGNSLQYSCLENPHGQRSLAGYSP